MRIPFMTNAPVSDDTLLDNAIEARENAYAPYSNFKVGAALLTRDGAVYTGCNIENQAYPSGMCAERVAVGKALVAGERWADFVTIAVVGTADEPCTPCGMCRQLLGEIYSKAARVPDRPTPDLRVIMIGAPDNRDVKLVKSLKELLPYGFEL
jgi:cytidine deaminase